MISRDIICLLYSDKLFGFGICAAGKTMLGFSEERCFPVDFFSWKHSLKL